MHVSKAEFALSRPEALAFASARGFGVIAASENQNIVASHLPFFVAETPDGVLVQFHVAPANPLVRLADGDRSFLVIASGLDSYISNDWYVSRDQVSTWLYEEVQLSGPARQLPFDEYRAHGDALLQRFERHLSPKEPWRLEHMEPGKRDSMFREIVVVEIKVTTLSGQRKFNQHKPDHDHIAVVRRLLDSDDPVRRQLGASMRTMRPDLAYSIEASSNEKKAK